ncbi:hypothetical protein [Methanoregula sp.]|uniref:hypothetical protein n=1 Tax=Methanoregula sp. TaxID=2052170 RepID=UPI0035657CC3
MTAALRLQEPFVLGDRKIYPVVSEICFCMERGMTALVSPVAILIEENGQVTGAVLGDASLEDIIGRLIVGKSS